MERPQVCPVNLWPIVWFSKETASVLLANFLFHFSSHIVYLHFAYFVTLHLLFKHQISGRKDMRFGKGREQIK